MFHGGWLVGGGGKPRSQGNIGVVLGTSSYHHQPVRGGEKAGKSTENCTLKPELANGTEQRVGEYTFILYFHYTDKHFYQVNHLPTEFLLGKMMTSRILGVG